MNEPKGPSARHEIFYFTESTLSTVRIDDYKYRFTDQPGGWLGATVKVDWPILCNLRLDPFERTGMFNGKDGGSIAYYDWFAYDSLNLTRSNQIKPCKHPPKPTGIRKRKFLMKNSSH
jgi:arylsulfatase